MSKPFFLPQDRITFIDWDGFGLNHEAFEIAVHWERDPANKFERKFGTLSGYSYMDFGFE